MIAQDTGSAIVGPARADIYWGAGDRAGRLAGGIRQPGRFAMLVPRELDPVEGANTASAGKAACCKTQRQNSEGAAPRLLSAASCQNAEARLDACARQIKPA